LERFVKGDIVVVPFPFSDIRPLRIFTIDKHIVFSKIGQITPERMNKVIDAIIFSLKQ